QQPAAAPGTVHRGGRGEQGVEDPVVAGGSAAGGGAARGEVGRRELEDGQPVLADGGVTGGVGRVAVVAAAQVLLGDGGAGRRGEPEVGGGRGDELDGGEAHLERGRAGAAGEDLEPQRHAVLAVHVDLHLADQRPVVLGREDQRVGGLPGHRHVAGHADGG